MRNKSRINKIVTAVLFISSVFLTCWCYRAREFSSIGFKENLIEELSKGSYISGIISAIGLSVIGMSFLKVLCIELEIYDMLILSIPFGAFVWIFASTILLEIGIYYNLITTLILIVLLFCFCRLLLFRNRRESERQKLGPFIWGSVAVLSLILIAASGAILIVMTYDSYYFIESLGSAIANNHFITQYYIQLLSHTSIGCATLSSYAFFCGRDNLICIHGCIFLSFVIYYVKKMLIMMKDRAIHEQIIILLSILSAPVVLYQLCYVISNSYVMFILFFIVCIYSRAEIKNERGYQVLSFLLFFVITCIRADGPIIVACILIGLSAGKVSRKDVMIYAWLPSVLATVLTYGRIVILNGGFKEEQLLNSKNVGMLLGVYVVVYAWYFIKDKVWGGIEPIKLYFLSILGMLMITFLLGVYRLEMTVTTLKTMACNFAEIKGANIWVLTMLLYLLISLRTKCENGTESINYVSCIVVLLFLMEINLAIVRGIEGIPARVGVGDSFSRAFASFMPTAYFALIYNNKDARNKAVARECD